MGAFSKILSFLVIIPALVGFYSNDKVDTELPYLEKVSQVGYENTVQTAIPQTDIYGMITEHFFSALPEGKTVDTSVHR